VEGAGDEVDLCLHFGLIIVQIARAFVLGIRIRHSSIDPFWLCCPLPVSAFPFSLGLCRG